MATSDLPQVTRHEDFERVYNLSDPRPYYRGLAPLGYRAPTIMARYLKAHRDTMLEARGRPIDRLSVIDFCCGYGANGALLTHQLTMADLFDRYAGDDLVESDVAFFATHRLHDADFEVLGIDIADRAVDYAQHCGLLDHASAANLAVDAVPRDVVAWLERVDVVVESGGVGPVLVPCYDRLLDAMEGVNEPWFVMCTRPDWDHDALWRVFRRHGYTVEPASDLLRYRYAMPDERAGAMERTRRLGRDPDRFVRNGVYRVPLMLARPAGIAAEVPIEALAYGAQEDDVAP